MKYITSNVNLTVSFIQCLESSEYKGKLGRKGDMSSSYKADGGLLPCLLLLGQFSPRTGFCVSFYDDKKSPLLLFYLTMIVTPGSIPLKVVRMVKKRRIR
jgi:hypothetical protein